MTTKECSVCKEEKTFDNFHSHKSHDDGVSSACKKCVKERRSTEENKAKDAKYFQDNKEILTEVHQKYYADNREKLIYNKKNYYEKNKEQYLQYNYEWIRNNKKARNAQSLVQSIVRCYPFVKPNKCSICNNTEKIEGHHEDYDKPTCIIWLCKKCHAQLHGGKNLDLMDKTVNLIKIIGE